MSPETRPSESRDRILAEARTLFLERGFAETSMQDIAEAVGMTKAALYYHFNDKTDLFSTMAFTEMERVNQGLRDRCSAERPLRENLVDAAAFLFESMDGDVPRLLIDAFKHLCVEDRLAMQSQKPDFERKAIAMILADSIEKGDIRKGMDPELLASLWFGMIFYQLQELHVQGHLAKPAPELSITIADLFLHGVVETGSHGGV